MNIYIRAFSLIELMVVIAIVAVLSAVAVPSYKNYVYKARAGQAYAGMYEIINRGYTYYAQKGVLPDIAGLGLTPRPGFPFTTPSTFPISAIYPYVFVLSVNPYDPSTYMGLYGCAIGDYSYRLALDQREQISVSDTLFAVSFSSFNINGAFYSICNYNGVFGDVLETTIPYLLPKCYDMDDQTQRDAFEAKSAAYVACNAS